MREIEWNIQQQSEELVAEWRHYMRACEETGARPAAAVDNLENVPADSPAAMDTIVSVSQDIETEPTETSSRSDR